MLYTLAFVVILRVTAVFGYLTARLENKTVFKRAFSYPGTKWCGPGNTASNYNDLGSSREDDMCCRSHDNCQGNIKSGEKRFELINDSRYTRVSCACDMEFRKCLHAAHGAKPSLLGIMYFDLIPRKCWRLDYEVTGCKERGGFFKRKCYKHYFDTSKPKRAQWFDVPGWTTHWNEYSEYT